jgi:hypothetical protein
MTEKQVQLLGFQKEILFGYDDEENDEDRKTLASLLPLVRHQTP